MTPTIQAVLARFGGNRGSAMDYVISVARAYPHLATEYWQILDILGRGRDEGVAHQRSNPRGDVRAGYRRSRGIEARGTAGIERAKRRVPRALCRVHFEVRNRRK